LVAVHGGPGLRAERLFGTHSATVSCLGRLDGLGPCVGLAAGPELLAPPPGHTGRGPGPRIPAVLADGFRAGRARGDRGPAARVHPIGVCAGFACGREPAAGGSLGLPEMALAARSRGQTAGATGPESTISLARWGTILVRVGLSRLGPPGLHRFRSHVVRWALAVGSPSR